MQLKISNRENMYTIISFNTTTDALAFEQMAKKNNFTGRIIPLPRAIGAGCGLCWREPIENIKKVEEIIINYSLEHDNIYQI